MRTLTEQDPCQKPHPKDREFLSPPSIEQRADEFERFAISLATQGPWTFEKVLKEGHKIFLIIGPGEIGRSVLRAVYDRVPEERRSVSNGDHLHARVWPIDNYVKGESNEVMVTLIKGNSNRQLKKHQHKQNQTELKGTPVENVVVVTESTEGDMDHPLKPGSLYASQKGEFHSIRNDGDDESVSFDVVAGIKESEQNGEN